MGKEIYFNEEEKIKNLLLYRKIVNVSDDTLYLDDGTKLEIVPNMGCGGCNSGWYHIEELNECDNVITDVEFVRDDLDEYGEDFSYKIFVFAENKKIKVLQVDGSDGNGYYGTGYSIYVKKKK